mgnify:CR=1 FL=1
MGLPMRPEDIQRLEKGIEIMNMLLESMNVKREGRKVTVEMVFKDELSAKAYVESLKVVYAPPEQQQ